MNRSIVNNKIHEGHTGQKVARANDIASIMQDIYKYNKLQEQEAFYLIGTDPANKIKLIELAELGTVNCAYPIIRELVKTCLLFDVTSVILCHNHPSGTLKPSVQDEKFTDCAKKAFELLGIALLDHIIVDMKNGFYSFADEGKL